MFKPLVSLSLIFSLIIFTGCTKEKKVLDLATISTTSQKEKVSETTIFEAARINDISLVKAFIKKGEDINKKDKFGYTPLHLAARFNHYDIVNLLIQSGASVDPKDRYGDTPLIDTTRNGYSRVSKLLICNGANREIIDKDGLTPFDYASKMNDVAITRLLKTEDLETICSGRKVQQEKFYDLITMDDYEVITTNKPKICGNVIDSDVRQVQISFDFGKSVIEAKIEGNRWCAQVQKELKNGRYTLLAMAMNSSRQRGKAQDEIIINSSKR